jgi:hypothetical protein
MRIVVLTGILLTAVFSVADSADDAFLERFVLADDRDAVLTELIPGTQDYYYYHCLHHQNNQRYDQVEDLLKKWIARHKTGNLINEILYRQAVLTWESDPQKSLEFIRRHCGLVFNHQKEALNAEPNLPESLNPDLISRDRLLKQAFADHNDLKGLTPASFPWLLETDLTPVRRRHLLGRLQRPDYPGLAKLVVADLNYKNSGSFGSLTIHKRLLLDQLKECARLMPKLLDHSAFVNVWLQRLGPDNDVNVNQNASEKDTQLNRLWKFVKSLSSVHNSLKAHVLYQRLDFNRARNNYDEGLFLQYIQLPRRAPYMNVDYMKQAMSQRYPADLSQDFTSFTRCPVIGNDEPLIRDYLHQLLIEADNADKFAAWLDDTYLTQRLAETKIVNGLGDPEQWYALLSPADYQRLRDRVDIDFSVANKVNYTAEEPISLDVFIKNVPTLIVKVFEVNTANFHRDFGREVNTDIDLDGLVANKEETLKYDEPPLRRVRRHFEFPGLSKRGVYIIDFIGNGQSSRALIRKGQLRFAVTSTLAGQEFRVFDETGQPADAPTVTLGTQKYEANDEGLVLVPFSTSPGRRAVIVASGDFSTLGHFQHQSENYELRAGILVDRQSLLRLRRAKVIVRPQLLLNGIPVSLSVLENVRFNITSMNHDEVSTTSTVTDFVLAEDREAEHEFLVPDRLSSITFSLTARVRNQSQSKDIDLQVSDVFAINAVDRTEKIEVALLSKVDNRYVVELLGRTGEPGEHRAIQFSVVHRDFTRPVIVSLRSNTEGKIDLGPLTDIVSVTAKLTNGVERTWQIGTDQIDQYRVVHDKAGATIRIPCLLPDGRPSRANISLCEFRGGEYFRDRFDAIRVKDSFAEIKGLPPGDYSLLLRDSGKRVLIRLTRGRKIGQFLIGDARVLERRRLAPLQISSIRNEKGKLKIQIANATKFARVHVFANNFVPAISHFGKLTRILNPGVTVQRHSDPRSVYAEGRKIGDEYRYILDRRMAEKYPGNMNARPEVLLNPWSVRSTQTDRRDAEKGNEFAPAADAPASAPATEAEAREEAGIQADFANLDFMAQQAFVATNLIVDEDGYVTIDLDSIGTHQHVHVVAVDPLNTAYRSYSLPDRSPQVLDQRLAETLPVDEHFSQQKQIDIVPADTDFQIADTTTSRYQIYDDLAGVYQLYQSLLNDPKLSEFRFIVDWPELEQERRQELYSQYACHELNFFLSRRDPEFFTQIVRPHLANKLDKTFLDKWLLGEDLSVYLTPRRYRQLNTVEKVLLGQRVAAEREVTERFIREQFQMMVPDTGRAELLFGTALNSQVMDWDVRELGEALADDDGVRFNRLAAPKGAAEVLARAKLLEARGENGRAQIERESGLTELSRKRSLMLSDSPGREGNFDAYFKDMRGRQALGLLFRQTEKTQEWAENNYYKLTASSQNAGLVSVNAFWADFASHNSEDPFFSSSLAEASRNFTEVMFALSVLDLPFKAGDHKQKQDGVTWVISAATPLAVVHEQIKPTSGTVDDLPILVSQNFFKNGDRYRIVNGQTRDRFVVDEFLVQTVYGCQVVLTNPTSSNQELSLLLQIPEGAIPVLNSHYTHSHESALEPYKTSSFEYYFYFPLAGEFSHYPVNVARAEQLVTSAATVKFRVVDQPTTQDTDSWDYVSQYASADDVIQYLKIHSLHQTNLSRIAWRMQDAEFFSRAIDLLSSQHAFDPTLWSYGVKHNDQAAIREYLSQHQQYVQTCGPVLASPLLDIQPVERNLFELLGYRPLVNARAHRLGREHRILNDRFRNQFTAFTKLLSYGRELDDRELLALSSYLLMQDRVTEALSFFSRINADKLSSRLQYDYMAGYCDFFDGELDVARNVVEKYQDYPVARWRNTFAAMAVQIKEIDNANERGDAPKPTDPDDRLQLLTQLAAGECNFEVAVDKQEVELDFQNLETIQVNYYLMDVELLFSRNPFVKQQSGNFAHIHPNLTETHDLPKKKSQFTFQLPKQLRNANVLVEVVGRGKTKRAAYYSNSLTVQMSDNYGQLRVTDSEGRRSLPGVYVKTYAKMKDGSTRFYKDGYTDLRGRFDYASLSTNELDHVDRFALLVMSEDEGAVVREVAPPVR